MNALKANILFIHKNDFPKNNFPILKFSKKAKCLHNILSHVYRHLIVMQIIDLRQKRDATLYA